jgi:hypothetical protein
MVGGAIVFAGAFGGGVAADAIEASEATDKAKAKR